MAICCRLPVAHRSTFATNLLRRNIVALLDEKRSKSSTTKSGKSLIDLLIEMPKEQKHLPELRHRRKEKRKQLAKFPSDNVFFQVLSSGAPGGGSSLLLHCAHKRFLFNCSEGTQRNVTEDCANRSLAQMAALFVTSKKWKCLGGFPGLALSVKDAGAPDIHVYGPKGCSTLFEATKNFIQLFEFEVYPHNVDEIHSDKDISVESIPIEYSGPAVIPPPPTYTPWNGLVELSKGPDGKPVFKDKAEEVIEHPPIVQDVMSYLITINGKPGALDPAKCQRLGVPPGPLYGQLKAGKTVYLEDGKVVEAKEVLSDPSPPTRCLVVDCPSQHYLPSLLKKLGKERRGDAAFAYVFHFTPNSVMSTQDYRKWLEEFGGEGCKHVVLNETNEGMSSAKLLTYHSRLKMIAPDLFPNLHGATTPVRENSDTIQARNALRLLVKPNTKIDDSKVEFFNQEEAEREVYSAHGFTIKAAHTKMVPDLSKPEYPRVTLLGTGSSIPNKYRNVTCILVEHKPDSFIVLDCGEGSVGQMYRHFGPERAQDIMRKTRAVYISHSHADHHLGLINFIQHRSEAFRRGGGAAAAGGPAGRESVDKLYVIAPGRFLPEFYLKYHTEFEPFLEDAYQVRCEHLILMTAKGTQQKTQILFPWVMKEMLEYVGIKNIFTSRAQHCPLSYCLSITTEDDFKLVFTGDTRPNEDLVELGRHLKTPDLVIHEATMEHLFQKDAIMKRHSTFVEAIESSREMGAAFTLLTHFSQRYAKVPVLDEIEGRENVGIAFDHLSVSPRTLGMLQHIYEPLKAVFKEEIEEQKDKNEHKIALRKSYNQFMPTNASKVI